MRPCVASLLTEAKQGGARLLLTLPGDAGSKPLLDRSKSPCPAACHVQHPLAETDKRHAMRPRTHRASSSLATIDTPFPSSITQFALSTSVRRSVAEKVEK